jgi:hypothetical protein
MRVDFVVIVEPAWELARHRRSVLQSVQVHVIALEGLHEGAAEWLASVESGLDETTLNQYSILRHGAPAAAQQGRAPRSRLDLS